MDSLKFSLERAGIKPTNEKVDFPAKLLEKSIENEDERSVVLLVDEYDAPLTAVLMIVMNLKIDVRSYLTSI